MTILLLKMSVHGHFLQIMLNTDGVPDAPFFSSLTEELNKSPILEKMNVCFSKILPYETELLKKNNSGEKEKYEDRGVTLIQNEMMDLEQEVVHELWKENLLNDSSYLIKDGSLEYSKRYSIKGHDLSKLKRRDCPKFCVNGNWVGVCRIAKSRSCFQI